MPSVILLDITSSYEKLRRSEVNSGNSTASPPPISTTACKILYNKLLTLENLPPPAIPLQKKSSYLMASQQRI